jgi:hypothetical protein
MSDKTMSTDLTIPYYVMIIDPLPASRLDIRKYLDRHNINVYEDFYKENLYRVKCQHDKLCGVYNELVMLKDFKRDDELRVKYKMDYIQDELFVVENSHITNLVYCRMSNKKLYKQYMKELKNRRRNWKYIAIVITKPENAKTKKDQQILKELELVLKQSQIDFKFINNWQTVTFLRKEILKELTEIRNVIEKQKKLELYGDGK